MSYNVWWVGADGNVYTRQGDTVTSQGKLINDYGQTGFDSERLSAGDMEGLEWARIDDPNAPTQQAAPTGGGSGSPGGNANELQYNDGAGGFAGAANLEIAKVYIETDY